MFVVADPRRGACERSVTQRTGGGTPGELDGACAKLYVRANATPMEASTMGLLDRVKAGAEQAASSAQRQAQLVQTKRELSQAYHKLGETVHRLFERGEVSHGDLKGGVDHVNELHARINDSGDSAASAGDSAGGSASEAGDAGEADIVE